MITQWLLRWELTAANKPRRVFTTLDKCVSWRGVSRRRMLTSQNFLLQRANHTISDLDLQRIRQSRHASLVSSRGVNALPYHEVMSTTEVSLANATVNDSSDLTPPPSYPFTPIPIQRFRRQGPLCHHPPSRSSPQWWRSQSVLLSGYPGNGKILGRRFADGFGEQPHVGRHHE